LYITTDEGAPKYKVVTIDLAIDGQKMRDFIPEDKEAKLTQISCVNQTYCVAIYQRNVSSYLFLPLLFLFLTERPLA
jgi:prolyl oligopeptidase